MVHVIIEFVSVKQLRKKFIEVCKIIANMK